MLPKTDFLKLIALLSSPDFSNQILDAQMLWLYAAYLSFQYGLRLHMNMDLPRGSATHPEYVHLVWLRKDIILMTLFLSDKRGAGALYHNNKARLLEAVFRPS